MGSAILMTDWVPSKWPERGREPWACCRRTQHRNQLSAHCACHMGWLDGEVEGLGVEGGRKRMRRHTSQVKSPRASIFFYFLVSVSGGQDRVAFSLLEHTQRGLPFSSESASHSQSKHHTLLALEYQVL